MVPPEEAVTETTSTGDQISFIVGSISTSTFTDEYDKTRTVIIRCSTESPHLTTDDIHSLENIDESSTKSKNQGQNMTSVNSHSTAGVIINTNDKPYDNNENNHNSMPTQNTIISWQAVVGQITSSSSSAAAMIQEAPNESPYNVIGSMYLIISLLISLFFM